MKQPVDPCPTCAPLCQSGREMGAKPPSPGKNYSGDVTKRPHSTFHEFFEAR